jgi:hypothetical protein
VTGFCCEGLKTLLGVGLNCGSELLLKMCWYFGLWQETQGFQPSFPPKKGKPWPQSIHVEKLASSPSCHQTHIKGIFYQL